ncbi:MULTISPECIES: antibiotic biosynthesis monooxygenase family protein [Pseudomonas syringae group]|uniref:Antibiotic biosynthesis monooxygenase protein n=6 Tax=Pseudomonas syringae group TaxID=136849 RepID=A0A3M5BCZ2_PSESS|nr:MULTISPECIES: antibiotic biosynthesis monooxygenase [Pseudomonas syringae group]EGH25280.1 antibiotic biosynthesis monooxygenase family protein [Pseudomonas amygdali pv. mori str. 301020]KPW62278.1 Antibiotic biosynthesis monooxygenase family protein [Pseudomonas syringae pv. broussonetiae]KPX05328.1 Antibiotic biosynthesis monooxygenase family protein [Pseudomonas syringae pv. cunninghamiae]EGH04455.1 antibiotic biosynthesis monooxygenase family protein [Pseudomonas amygdali pv. aesculi str
MMAARFPTPYFAVVFTSLRTSEEGQAYADAAQRMVELARQQPGFLGVESARDEHGLGITVSYWSDETAILAWKQQADHAQVREQGRARWYQAFTTRICKVERDYSFNG